MQKLRYLAYDFNMEDLAKLVFEKKGKILVPEFEHGRILLKELETDNKQMKRAELYLLRRPFDEESEVSSMFAIGFDQSMMRAAFGEISITRKIGGSKTAKFDINVNQRSKGYGTVLMNAGAKYCRDVGIEGIRGTLLKGDNIKRRVDFYKSLGMDAWMHEEAITANVNTPGLSEIKFTQNTVAEDLLNSTIKH